MHSAQRDQALEARIEQFGDRTSSSVLMGRQFDSFLDPLEKDGAQPAIRYVDFEQNWIGANEPLVPTGHRASYFRQFAQSAEALQKRATMVPVSEQLSSDLQAKGYDRIQVGSEPVFDLPKIYSDGFSPIEYFPKAKKLAESQKYKIESIRGDQVVASLRLEIEKARNRRQISRGSSALGFLNHIESELIWSKWCKIYVLQSQAGMAGAIISFPLKNKSAEYFFELLTTPLSRHGTLEALFNLSLDHCHKANVSEVRMGMSALSRLKPVPLKAGLQKWLASILMNQVFRSKTTRYRFQANYQFKQNLNPSRWEDLYLVTSAPFQLKDLWNLLKVHRQVSAGWGLKKFFSIQTFNRWVESSLKPHLVLRPLPQSWTGLIRASALSLSLVAMMAALHIGRVADPSLAQWFYQSAFIPSQWTWQGLIFAPIFHNNYWHLFGDLLCFAFFCGAIEVLMGRRWALLIIAIGLWSSNPLTAFGVGPVISLFGPGEWAVWSAIRDYGSSNAVYCAVGACAYLTRYTRWLVLPFAFNGMVFCLMAWNWLGIHHFVAMGLGYALARWRLK